MHAIAGAACRDVLDSDAAIGVPSECRCLNQRFDTNDAPPSHYRRNTDLLRVPTTMCLRRLVGLFVERQERHDDLQRQPGACTQRYRR